VKVGGGGVIGGGGESVKLAKEQNIVQGWKNLLSKCGHFKPKKKSSLKSGKFDTIFTKTRLLWVELDFFCLASGEK